MFHVWGSASFFNIDLNNLSQTQKRLGRSSLSQFQRQGRLSRGRSSVVELQPSKLVARVRFSPPALNFWIRMRNSPAHNILSAVIILKTRILLFSQRYNTKSLMSPALIEQSDIKVQDELTPLS